MLLIKLIRIYNFVKLFVVCIFYFVRGNTGFYNIKILEKTLSRFDQAC